MPFMVKETVPDPSKQPKHVGIWIRISTEDQGENAS
jgi:hypothetical protein